MTANAVAKGIFIVRSFRKSIGATAQRDRVAGDRGQHRPALNQRLCGQFADLYAKVDGRGGYEVALALATGAALPPRRAGSFPVAASVPLRTFQSVRVGRAPTRERLTEVERLHPGTLAFNECASGQHLQVMPDVEDGCSARYGVLNLGAESRSDVLHKSAVIASGLGYELAPATE